MSRKYRQTASAALEFDATLNRANKILKNEKHYKIAFLVILGINVGLRIYDLKKLTFEDLENDSLGLTEKKTNKKRVIQFNENVKTALEIFKQRNKVTTGGLFVSNRNTVFSVQYVNKMIKKLFGKSNMNVSSHSLRKTFGRRVWDSNNQTDAALVYLSEIFNHSNVAVTRRYLGIRQQEIAEIYRKL